MEVVELDPKMQEIVDLAMEDGLGNSASDIIRLALTDWWSGHLLSGYTQDELQQMCDEAIADTRPGRPAEEVFAELEEFCRNLEAERSADAA